MTSDGSCRQKLLDGPEPVQESVVGVEPERDPDVLWEAVRSIPLRARLARDGTAELLRAL